MADNRPASRTCRRIRQRRLPPPRRRRPARRRRVPPQSRGDLAGAATVPARHARRRPGDRQRHRPARRRVRPAGCRRSPGGRPTSTTVICAASSPGATTRSSTTCKPPVRLDASAADWRLANARPAAQSSSAIFCANVIHIAPWAVAEGLVRRRRPPSRAPADGCSSTARSSATARTTRRATPRSTRACAREIRNGACATPPICARSPRRTGFALSSCRNAVEQRDSDVRADQSGLKFSATPLMQ